jgi:hypothetical protein
VSGIKIGRAEPQAIAGIVVILIGIANNDTHCRCRKVLPRREHGGGRRPTSYSQNADISEREFRIWYRVSYLVLGRGAVETLDGGALPYRVPQRSEAAASWHPPIAPKLAPFLSCPLTVGKCTRRDSKIEDVIRRRNIQP